MRSLALVLLVALGCAKRPVLYIFEPPPVGAAYTRRDVEVHHRLAEVLMTCQQELDRRWAEDRASVRRKRILLAAHALLMLVLGLVAGNGTPPSMRPCDRGRELEDECTPQALPMIHIGPTYAPDGTFADTPRAGQDLRADIDATLRQLDELLERPELEVDRDAVLVAIDLLRRECTPSPLPGDPAPATLAP
ncbi:MAG: hypothetical protein H6724_11645 [Sandaracinus sp.]|nr:hypothetical protein [Sandaracinus sp.]MCB9620087.1 hypothetical protein [Sandaracinus sp.]